MATTKIKVGDTVMVRKGADKGTTGKVLEIDMINQRVLVEGVNVRTKHQKPNQLGKDAGIFKQPRMIALAKVGLAHPTKKNITGRVGFTINKDGGKKRVFKATGKEAK